MTKVVRKQLFSNAVVQDADGRIVFNSFMVNDGVVRRTYDDGLVDLVRRSNGEVILERYDPTATCQSGTLCPICGRER